MQLRKKAIVLIFSSCLFGYAQISNPPTTPDQYGQFTGVLQFQEDDGVNKIVLQTYSYTDTNGHTLTADSGFKTDGASIPRALWTFVGSPFTGKYVGAAVIHDVGCDTHKYSWQITHRMFYTAMLALGVRDDYAKILYWGVRLGGPKWTEQVVEASSVGELRIQAKNQTGRPLNEASINEIHHGIGLPTYQATIQVPITNSTVLSDDDAKRIFAYVQAREPSAPGSVNLDEIDKRTPLTGPLPSDAIPQ
jgi:hypothetical protein